MPTLVASHTSFRTWGAQNPVPSVLHLLDPCLASRLLKGQHLDLGLVGPCHGWRRGRGRDDWGPGTLLPPRSGPGQ